MKKRLKVMVSAYACNPYRGSEEGVGWGWVTMLAGHHELWVLTASFHREDIEQAVAADPERYRKMHFHYIPHSWRYIPKGLWIKIENSLFKPLMHIAYCLWLRDAGRLGTALHNRFGFDLIHQITYVGFRFPGHLWKLDAPFVWGPIGGLVNVPWRLLPVMGSRGALEYGLRNIVNTVQKKLLPGPKHAFGRAKAVIAATSGIRSEIMRWYGRESKVICEVGPPRKTVSAIVKRNVEEPFVIAWSGEHLPGKALPLLLGAMARIDESMNWRLEILGKGPLTGIWRQQAESYGLNEYCRWHGWVKRDTALQIVRNAHVLVITSMKDLTSTVLVEAFAQGVPVICPDHCGFADVVTSDCGIRIPVQDRDSFERGLSKSLKRLEANEGWRRDLALGALARVKDFTWKRKAEQLNMIYHNVIS